MHARCNAAEVAIRSASLSSVRSTYGAIEIIGRLSDMVGATGDPLEAVAVEARVFDRNPAWNLLGFEAASAEVSGTTSDTVESSAESVALLLLPTFSSLPLLLVR